MSLFRHTNFRLLWLGQAVSEIGSAVTLLILPLLAITALGATPAEIGILKACATLVVLVGSIPAGLLVDRARKRPIMIFCDVARALILVSVPILALFEAVTMIQLYIVAALVGILTLVFGIAYHAYYPALLTKDLLPEANSKIASSEAFARVSGPGVGATLAGAIGAAATIVVNVVSYLASAVSLLLIRAPEPVPAPVAAHVSWRGEAREGLRLVTADSVLTRTAITTVASMFCLFMADTVFIYFLVHDLGMSTWRVGVVFAVGEVGGLLAAVVAAQVMRRVGTARIMVLALLATPAGFLLAFATPQNILVLACVFMILSSARFVLFDIAQYSYRQTVSPLDKLGKVTATIRLAVGIAVAAGALVGGWLGVLVGSRETIIVATALGCLAALPVIFSPLRAARDIEDLPTVAAGQHQDVTEAFDGDHNADTAKAAITSRDAH